MIDGEYSSLFQAVCHGNYESALASDVVHKLLKTDDLDISCISLHTLQIYLRKNMESFLSAESKYDAYLRLVQCSWHT